MSQNDDSKFDIKFSSHGHSKTYWVSVPSFLYTQVCVCTELLLTKSETLRILEI